MLRLDRDISVLLATSGLYCAFTPGKILDPSNGDVHLETSRRVNMPDEDAYFIRPHHATPAKDSEHLSVNGGQGPNLHTAPDMAMTPPILIKVYPQSSRIFRLDPKRQLDCLLTSQQELGSWVAPH